VWPIEEKPMAKSDVPPVPPAGRSDKGPAATGQAEGEAKRAPTDDPRKRDLAKQGHQGNVNQNTRHQGYQQDR
jgi:hypothetical protein